MVLKLIIIFGIGIVMSAVIFIGLSISQHKNNNDNNDNINNEIDLW